MMLNIQFISTGLDEKICKSISHAGQVQVERIETNKRTGTVYSHKHWCNVKDMKPGDIVVQGHEHLPDDHPQKLHPVVQNLPYKSYGYSSSELREILGTFNAECYKKGSERYITLDDGKKYTLQQISDKIRKIEKGVLPWHSELKTKLDRYEFKNSVLDYVDDSSLYHELGITAVDKYSFRLLKQMKQMKIKRTPPAYSQSKINEAIENYKQKFLSGKLNFFVSDYDYSHDTLEDAVQKGNTTRLLKAFQQELISYVRDYQNSMLGTETHLLHAVLDWVDIVKQGKIKDTPMNFLTHLNTSFFRSVGPYKFEEFQRLYDLDLSPFVSKNPPPEPDIDHKEIKARLLVVSDYTAKKLTDMIVKDFSLHPELKTSYKDGVFKNQYGWEYRIKHIYKIEGLDVEDEFQKIVKKNAKYADKYFGGKNGQLDYFYHGTTLYNSQRILGDSGGFKSLGFSRLGTSLGDGIFLADASSKSLGYTDSEESQEQYKSTGCLFICEASLGDCLFGEEVYDAQSDEAFREHIMKYYDSCGVPIGIFSQQEWKVNSDTSVIPRYYVEIELTNLKQEGDKHD